MSAQLIYDLVPLGSIVTYSDGSPRPPKRHRKKLATWENRNGGGRLIRKHKGDYGSQGTIVLRVHQAFSVNNDLKFSVKERPSIGTVLVLDRAGDDAELVHLAANRTAAEERLSRHGYPNAVLQQVTADTVAADTVAGRTAA
ncbi:hypothetical protein [Mesorhizobium erdmanii]|uniref:hypothetical protein n=1 Tax=Mesorhizobium erdmanii TaxID=1777866 RepID=UPI000428B668|nr:hypothetical protein [Mesorhizobium erdmanii]